MYTGWVAGCALLAGGLRGARIPFRNLSEREIMEESCRKRRFHGAIP